MASPLLILGAGYLGAALAELALEDGRDVVLVDNWHTTDRRQLEGLERLGARVESGDVRRRQDLDRVIGEGPSKVYLLAAQASRALADREPDYTEETNVTGARRVAEAVAAVGGVPLVYASSLNVYGPDLKGKIDAGHSYGRQNDLSHLAKIYAELCLELYARRHGFDLAILRLGILYGPSPVEHERSESQTVVDRFRRLAADGSPLRLDDSGRAAIGVVHVEDAARVLLAAPEQPGITVANVAAETVTVATVAALARGEPADDKPSCTFASPFQYRHSLADYLRA